MAYGHCLKNRRDGQGSVLRRGCEEWHAVRERFAASSSGASRQDCGERRLRCPLEFHCQKVCRGICRRGLTRNKLVIRGDVGIALMPRIVWKTRR